ncbi:MAG: AAA family ATPase [Candidatus Diapherotrites archaeon]|nr:AAA family ATPase [Candidatus Diapherotrites archaeon]
MLLVFFGLPATGKTFLAKEISKMLGFQYLNMDNTNRNAVAGEIVFSKMCEFLEGKLSAGKGFVVDGSFSVGSERRRIKEIADKQGQQIVFIEMTASEAAVQEADGRGKILFGKTGPWFEEIRIVQAGFFPFAALGALTFIGRKSSSW